jgi:hypothetical protein
MNRTEHIHSFFDLYAIRFNLALKGEKIDPAEVNGSFAPTFVEASPQGVVGKKNSGVFRKMFPKGISRYRKAGIKLMYLVDKEITLLNDLHAMTTVQWQAFYENKSGAIGEISFKVIYLLQTCAKECKIFAYIKDDEEQALKEHGLI